MSETASKKGLSRRQFLMGAAGVSVVVIGGAGYWAARQPALSFAEASYENSGSHVLVAYASQYGSTGGVADAIGQALHEAGAQVDVRRISATFDAAGYDAAVIGAPVISEAWMPDAVDFLARSSAALAGIPTAVFLTSMELALTHDAGTSQVKMADLLAATVTPHIQPVEYGLFAGALDYGSMSPAMAVLYRVFSEDDTDGDYRDFNTIRAWSAAVAPRLLSQ